MSHPCRILVIGGSGFVGRWLVKRLLSDGILSRQILVADRNSRGFDSSFQQVKLDLLQPNDITYCITDYQPTHIIHLAAISSVQEAELDVRQAWAVNFEGTLKLVLAIRERCPASRLLYVSTAEVYGSTFAKGPVDESCLLCPISTYGATKAASEMLISQMAGSGLNAISARPFNHTGPGQDRRFLIPSLAAQIIDIELGRQEALSIGNLDVQREFLDVQDIVDAYCRIIYSFDSLPQGAVLNLCSEQVYSIRQIVDRFEVIAGRRLPVLQDPSRVRKRDIAVMAGRARVAFDLLGWRAATPLDHTLRRVLEHSRHNA